MIFTYFVQLGGNSERTPSICVQAGYFIYMQLVKLFSLENETWRALTVLSLDFEKGDAFKEMSFWVV